MYSIVNVLDFTQRVDEGIAYIHDKWGDEDNLVFYQNCVEHSLNDRAGIPRFYLMLKDDKIVGCFALLTNDLISRQDLYPWFACLYIEESERGQRLSEKMFVEAFAEAKRAGFDTLYLTTDHIDLYEKYGWERIEDGYEPDGERVRIYRRPCV